jgi:hypothetical protein
MGSNMVYFLLDDEWVEFTAFILRNKADMVDKSLMLKLGYEYRHSTKQYSCN